MKNTSSCHNPPCKHSLNWSRRWFFLESWRRPEGVETNSRGFDGEEDQPYSDEITKKPGNSGEPGKHCCVIRYVCVWYISCRDTLRVWYVTCCDALCDEIAAVRNFTGSSQISKVKTCATNDCLTSIPQTFNSWKEVLWTIILLITLFKTILTYIYLCSRSLMSKKYISYIF